MTDKKKARQSVQAIRRSMSLEDNAVLSGIIKDKVLSLPEYIENNNIYAYMSFGNEVDVRPIMEAGTLSRKNIAVPRVDGDSMFFHLLNNNSGLFSGLVPGYMGIEEPDKTLPLFEEKNGIIIVPGVAFDRQCHRIGHGKGFYDRFLAKHPALIKIGVAFDFQIFDEIKSEEFDIAMDYIVTETQIISRKDNLII